MSREYGSMIRAAAMRCGEALLDAATRPEGNPYIKQADLKEVARYGSDAAMNDVMTCLALHATEVCDGAALFRNRADGYRLSTSLEETLDLIEHRRRMRTIITMAERLTVEASAVDNDPILHRWARKLDHLIEDELVPYEEMIGERL